jgi:glycosyltransferase involved in cell wall biosynthesis
MPVLQPHPAYFRAAVQSVLRQTLPDFELIILEEPSEVSAAKLLEGLADPRIRHLLHGERTCLRDQLNRGLAGARAEVVARFDADDLCEPDRFEKQLAYLDAHADVAVLGSQLRMIDGKGDFLGYRAYPLEHAAIVRAMRRFNPLAHPSVIFRKAPVVDAGGYQQQVYVEDYELWCRLARRGACFANHPEPLLNYRIHPWGMKAAQLRGMLRATLEVKSTYWREEMDAGSRFRLWAEQLLLWLPASFVFWLFLKLHMSAKLQAASPASPTGRPA